MFREKSDGVVEMSRRTAGLEFGGGMKIRHSRGEVSLLLLQESQIQIRLRVTRIELDRFRKAFPRVGGFLLVGRNQSEFIQCRHVVGPQCERLQEAYAGRVD